MSEDVTSFVARPIPPRAWQATARERSYSSPSIPSLSISMSTGTAALAAGPISPNARAASNRMSESASLKTLTRAGTAISAFRPKRPSDVAAITRTQASPCPSALIRAEIVPSASGPICPNAPAARARTFSCVSPSIRTSAGTAGSASRPIWPSARAARQRTSTSGSWSIPMRTGTPCSPHPPSVSAAAGRAAFIQRGSRRYVLMRRAARSGPPRLAMAFFRYVAILPRHPRTTVCKSRIGTTTATANTARPRITTIPTVARMAARRLLSMGFLASASGMALVCPCGGDCVTD